MRLYELNKELTLARERGFKINQIKKLKIKICSNLPHITIHHYLKLRITIMRRKISLKITQNREYIQTHCIDNRNFFLFACHKWY